MSSLPPPNSVPLFYPSSLQLLDSVQIQRNRFAWAELILAQQQLETSLLKTDVVVTIPNLNQIKLSPNPQQSMSRNRNLSKTRMSLYYSNPLWRASYYDEQALKAQLSSSQPIVSLVSSSSCSSSSHPILTCSSNGETMVGGDMTKSCVAILFPLLPS
jgi:hypothetical protein